MSITLSDLPKDVLARIMMYLSEVEVIGLERVEKSLRRFIETPSFWMSRFRYNRSVVQMKQDLVQLNRPYRLNVYFEAECYPRLNPGTYLDREFRFSSRQVRSIQGFILGLQAVSTHPTISNYHVLIILTYPDGRVAYGSEVNSILDPEMYVNFDSSESITPWGAHLSLSLMRANHQVVTSFQNSLSLFNQCLTQFQPGLIQMSFNEN